MSRAFAKRSTVVLAAAIALATAVTAGAAAVTVALNLDTAVVFLTPVLVLAARARRIDERPFVYGAVFMSNSASLLLPGSNLTNLVVLDGSNVPGLDFARAMLLHAEWLVSHGLGDGAQPLLDEAQRIFAELRARPWLDRAITAQTLVVT